MALTVTTIGDGAMATVCSQILASRADVTLTMWVREADHLAEMRRDRENKRYLPGVSLVDGIRLEGDGQQALAGAELIVCAVPTQYMRGTLERLKAYAPAGVSVVSVVKGIEIETLKRPSEIIVERLGLRPVAALSGPNIAGELVRHLPATMVAASADEELSRRVQ